MNEKLINTISTGRLIGKYLAKDRPESLRTQMDAWLEENPGNKKLLEELQNESTLSDKLEEMEQYNPGMAWKLLLQEAILKQKERLLRRWKVAAVIILLLGVGGAASQFFYNRTQHSTLSSMNTTVQTERGQTSKVILPDSTVVYLNSATKLVYSNNFLVENRNVKVDGEAYFKVFKDKEHPFLVNCNDIQVKVYGTEFNVCTDTNDKMVDVILDQGRVELLHNNGKFNNTVLKPGERAQFNETNNQLTVEQVDSYKYTSWRDGVLIFEDEPMDEVFKKLESWYDINIDVKNNEIYNLKFNATILDESLEDLFSLMKYSCGIEFQIIYSREPQVSSTVIVSLNKNGINK